jgi:hypothetical protein
MWLASPEQQWQLYYFLFHVFGEAMQGRQTYMWSWYSVAGSARCTGQDGILAIRTFQYVSPPLREIISS